MIDIQEKKNKIVSFLEKSGPSLPVQIARAIEMEPMFTSAILSELLGTRKIKTSHMKIGSSPLYLIPGQEEQLEKYTEHLKSIEKESQEKLKTNKIIQDDKEAPAIRVALRNIKDFAIPFKSEDKIFWKYAFAPKEEIKKILTPKKQEEKPRVEIKESDEKKEEPKKIESIFKEKEIRTPKQPETQKKTFLEEIETFLKNQNTKIAAIEEVDKKKVVATIESENTKSMLFAFNKLRINEAELMKCYKSAEKKNLPYQIIIKGYLTKKLNETIEAYQKLLKVDTLEI